jgi:hypothetical protein
MIAAPGVQADQFVYLHVCYWLELEPFCAENFLERQMPNGKTARE